MSIELGIDFLEKTPSHSASSWSYADVIALAARKLPDIFFGDQLSILRGDQHRLWLRWFLEGIVSPLAIARNPDSQQLQVYERVFKRVQLIYPGIELARHMKMSDKITEHLYAEVERLRADFRRDFASPATRLELLSERTPPRCYLCGFPFSQEAQDAFTQKKGRNPPTLPILVDVFRPRLKLRDITIEIEHVVPVTQGGRGQANLRLACGWCNKHKSSRVSLYDAAFFPAQIQGFPIGSNFIHELPQPFWTIRLLALRGRCHHTEGCDRTTNDSELFVSLIDWSGSPNPINLITYCGEHDPIGVDRWQSLAEVEKLWKERRR